MLEGPQEGGQCEEGGDYEELEEGEYHLLGEVVEGGEGLTYEVPIPTIPTSNPASD